VTSTDRNESYAILRVTQDLLSYCLDL